jgi:hypothetical protein
MHSTWMDERVLNIAQLRHECGCTQRDAVAALNGCRDDIQLARRNLQAVRADNERKRDAARRRALDPSARVDFAPHDDVQVQGLKARPALNGRMGRVELYVAEKQRYRVHLEGEAKPVAIKAINLQHLDGAWAIPDSGSENGSEEDDGENHCEHGHWCTDGVRETVLFETPPDEHPLHVCRKCAAGYAEEQAAEHQAEEARLLRLRKLGGIGAILADAEVLKQVLKPERHGLRTLCRLRRVCRCFRDTVRLPCIIMAGGGFNTSYLSEPINTSGTCLDLGRMAWTEAIPLPHPLLNATMCAVEDDTGQDGIIVVGGTKMGTRGRENAEDASVPGMPPGLALDPVPRGSRPGPRAPQGGSGIPGDPDYEPKMRRKPAKVFSEQVWRGGTHRRSRGSKGGKRQGWTELQPLPKVPVRAIDSEPARAGGQPVEAGLTYTAGRSGSRDDDHCGPLQAAGGRPSSCVLDGRLLVAGGHLCYPGDWGGRMARHDIQSRHTASVVAYCPKKGRWETLASMIRPRSGHHMGVLADGRVMVVGGDVDQDPLLIGAEVDDDNLEDRSTTAEIYCPRTDVWTLVTAPAWTDDLVQDVMPVGMKCPAPNEYRCAAGCVAADGRFTVSGGVMVASDRSLAALRRLERQAGYGEIEWDEFEEAQKMIPMSTVLAYDVDSDSWTELPNMLNPCSGHNMFCVGADLIIFDLRVTPDHAKLTITVRTRLEVFESSTQTWCTLKARSPAAAVSGVQGHNWPDGAAVAVIHCVGGTNPLEWSSRGPDPVRVVGLDSKQLSCDYCGTPTCDLSRACAVTPHDDLYCCMTCRNRWYCSSKCQRADYAAHKTVCDRLRLDMKMQAAIAKAAAVEPDSGVNSFCMPSHGEEPEPESGSEASLATLERDLLIGVLTAGSLGARDLGRLACVSRCFTGDLIEEVAKSLVQNSQSCEAKARLQFEAELELMHTREVEKEKNSFHDFAYPLSRANIIEIYGYEGELDEDEWPTASELEDEQRENAEAKRNFEVVKAQLAATKRRKAECATPRNPSLEPLMWLPALSRTTQPLVFSECCEKHMSIWCGGRVAMPKKTRDSAYTSAVCADDPMTEGVHLADFEIGKATCHVTLGIMLASHDPCAYNPGRGTQCSGPFCGRPTDTKSAWGFGQDGFVKHIWGNSQPAMVGEADGFAEGTRGVSILESVHFD